MLKSARRVDDREGVSHGWRSQVSVRRAASSDSRKTKLPMSAKIPSAVRSDGSAHRRESAQEKVKSAHDAGKRRYVKF
jgi:hypothetical protein